LRIVVFSDSHSNFFALKNIVRSQRFADIFIHLGDGERDFDELARTFPGKEMYNVRGNCDWASITPAEGILRRGGKTILYTHGHLLRVKAGIEQLKADAHKVGADIALFGHTHHAFTSYENGLHLMNPGSVTFPETGGPSYGIVDITDAGIFLSIVRL